MFDARGRRSGEAAKRTHKRCLRVPPRYRNVRPMQRQTYFLPPPAGVLLRPSTGWVTRVTWPSNAIPLTTATVGTMVLGQCDPLSLPLADHLPLKFGDVAADRKLTRCSWAKLSSIVLVIGSVATFGGCRGFRCGPRWRDGGVCRLDRTRPAINGGRMRKDRRGTSHFVAWAGAI